MDSTETVQIGRRPELRIVNGDDLSPQGRPNAIDAGVWYERDQQNNVIRSHVVRRWHTIELTSGLGCRLCFKCTAKHGPDLRSMCLVQVHGEVGQSDAANFSADWR